MNWGIRGSVLAAGAAALISTQAVYAAPPAPTSAGVDPLVSLSVLSAPQPSATLIGSTAVAQGTTKTCPDGSVVNSADPCPGVYVAPAKSISPLLIILGLVIFAGLVAALISGGSDAHGDLTPVSPA